MSTFQTHRDESFKLKNFSVDLGSGGFITPSAGSIGNGIRPERVNNQPFGNGNSVWKSSSFSSVKDEAAPVLQVFNQSKHEKSPNSTPENLIIKNEPKNLLRKSSGSESSGYQPS